MWSLSWGIVGVRLGGRADAAAAYGAGVGKEVGELVTAKEALLFACYIGSAVLLGALFSAAGSTRRRLTGRAREHARPPAGERAARVTSGSPRG